MWSKGTKREMWLLPWINERELRSEGARSETAALGSRATGEVIL